MITSILDILLIWNNNDLQNRKAIHDDKIDFVKNRWPLPVTAVDTPVNTPVDIHVDIHVVWRREALKLGFKHKTRFNNRYVVKSENVLFFKKQSFPFSF